MEGVRRFVLCGPKEIPEIEINMNAENIVVHVKEKENVDRAFKRFKKKFEKIGVLRKLREKMRYKKKSVERRDEEIKAIYKQKMQAKERDE